MPVITQCPKCGKKLRAPDDRLGKQAKCPQCKNPFTIQAAAGMSPGADGGSAQPRPTPRPQLAAQPIAHPRPQPTAQPITQPRPQPTAQPTVTAQGNWFVQMADGTEYGPVSKHDLDAWVTEDRLDRDSQVLQEGWAQWKWAEDVYPQLAGGDANPFAGIGGEPQGAASANPFASIGGVDTNPYASSQNITATSEQRRSVTGDDAKLVRVDTGLQIAFYGLIASGIGFLFFYIGLFGSFQSVVSAFGRGFNPTDIKAVMILLIWGLSAMLGGLAAFFAGTCVCIVVPRSLKINTQITAAICALGGSIVLSHSTILLAAAEVDSLMSYKMVFWLFVIAAKAGFVLFAFFLAGFGRDFPQLQLNIFAIGYGALEGVAALWSTLVIFGAVSPDSLNPKLILAINMVFGLASYGYLVFLVFSARTSIRKLLRP